MEAQNQTPTIGKLALALSKAQGLMEGAKKDSDNPFFHSKYADLHQCIEAAREALCTNELAVIQTTQDSEKGVTIITTLAHSSGEWIRGELTMKPKKDDDQGRGSSITYGRRYTFAAIVGLAQKDDDGQGSVKEDDKKPSGKKQEDNKPKGPATNPKNVSIWVGWMDKNRNAGCTPEQIEKAFTDNIEAQKASFSEDDYNELLDYKNDMVKEIKQGNKV
jgi:hypothetical protein